MRGNATFNGFGEISFFFSLFLVDSGKSDWVALRPPLCNGGPRHRISI